MKRIMTITLLALSFLGAYELGTDSWNKYTVFNPAERVLGMTYPLSWITPDPLILHPIYEDSSKTFGSWDQIIDFGGTDLSSLIVAQYIPYSFPQRWSVGMNFVMYNGPNPTKRTDIVFDYQFKKGMFNAFHTDNTQTLKLNNATSYHYINSNALNFNYQLAKKLKLSGGLDFQIIEQEEAIIDTQRHYDANHEFLQLGYMISQPFQLYAKFEHQYFQNDDIQNTMIVFRPGLKYTKGIFMMHLAMRISPNKFFPIAQLKLHPGPFFLETYAKVRNPIFILRQPGYPYYGIKSGVDYQGERHKLKVEVEFTYDNTGIQASNNQGPIYIPENFYMLNTHAEYHLYLQKVELYLSGNYHDNFNSVHYFYHPEVAAFSSGFIFHAGLAEGKLLLDGDINAKYIIHDDPDSVNFDPITMRYYAPSEVDRVGDWKINLKLIAHISTFSISLNLSTPIKASKNMDWHLYEGIYGSSDLKVGNTFYAGLNIQWLWWK